MPSPQPPQDDPRQELVVEHLHLVQHVVNQLATRYPRHVDRQELWNAGALGLVDAANRFESSLGVDFPRYAMIRIRGAIIDSTRSRDWATRSVRRSQREIRHARERFQHDHGREPGTDELARLLGITIEELHAQRSEAATAQLLHLDQRIGEDGDGATFADLVEEQRDEALPEQRLQQRELVGTLRAAVAVLPDVQREVVERSYLGGEYLRDIAESLGVTEARVSQIRSEAVAALRAYFARMFEGVPEVAEATPGRRRRGAYLRTMHSQSTWRSRLAAADVVPLGRSA